MSAKKIKKIVTEAESAKPKKKAPKKQIVTETQKKQRIGVKPNAGRSSLHIVQEHLYTPITKIRHCSLVTPFFYHNGKKGRYSVVVSFEREDSKQNSFLEWIDAQRKECKVPCVTYKDATDLYLMKFQTPEQIPVFEIKDNEINPNPMQLRQELQEGDLVQVKFNLCKYNDKATRRWKFNLKPLEIIYYSDSFVEKEFFDVDY